MRLKYFVFIVFLCFGNTKFCLSKNILDFSIFITNDFDVSKFMIFLDDGKENKLVDVKFVSNIFTIKQEVIAENATITIAYLSNDLKYRGVRLIVFTNKKSYIKLFPTNQSEENKLVKYELKNSIDEVRNPEFYKIKKFCKDEIDSNIIFSKIYNQLKTDSIRNIYNLSSIKLASKQLEYLKKVKKINTYHLWFFNTNIVGTLKKTHKKELLDFFIKKMPMSYQKSEYGILLKEKLVGNLYVKKGEKAPLFQAVGYTGDTIILEKFRNKYVLTHIEHLKL